MSKLITDALRLPFSAQQHTGVVECFERIQFLTPLSFVLHLQPRPTCPELQHTFLNARWYFRLVTQEEVARGGCGYVNAPLPPPTSSLRIIYTSVPRV